MSQRVIVKCPSRAGFSLIELLIVMGILMLLVGLLAPTVGGVMDLFRSGACRSNLRSCYHILKIYSSSNVGAYPAIGRPDGLVEAEWIRMCDGLAKNSKLMRCPSAKNVDTSYTVTNTNPATTHDPGYNNNNYMLGGTEVAWSTNMEPAKTKWNKGQMSGSYAYNLWVSSTWPGWNVATLGGEVPDALVNRFWNAEGSIEDSTPILMDGYFMGALPWDSRKFGGKGNILRTDDLLSLYIGGGMDTVTMRRHGTRHVNVIFADDSARDVDVRDQLWRLPWHKDYLGPRSEYSTVFGAAAGMPCPAGSEGVRDNIIQSGQLSQLSKWPWPEWLAK